jgi:hypothetical protein
MLAALSWQSCPGSLVCQSCSWQSCLGSPVQTVLSWQSFPDSHVLPTLFCLPCSACPFLHIQFCLSSFACTNLPVLCYPFGPAWLSCPGTPIEAALSWQLCALSGSPFGPVLPVLFCRSCPAVQFCLSCSACPFLPVLFCLSCSACLVLPVLFCLSCSACPVLPVQFLPILFCLSCSACPVLPVLFFLSCSACLVLPFLFCLSYKRDSLGNIIIRDFEKRDLRKARLATKYFNSGVPRKSRGNLDPKRESRFSRKCQKGIFASTLDPCKIRTYNTF